MQQNPDKWEGYPFYTWESAIEKRVTESYSMVSAVDKAPESGLLVYSLGLGLGSSEDFNKPVFKVKDTVDLVYPIDWIFDFEHGFIKILGGPVHAEPIDPESWRIRELPDEPSITLITLI